MIFIILSIILFIWAVLIFIRSEYMKEFGFLPLIASIIIIVFFITCRVSWHKKYVRYKITNITIENKIETIKQMRKTYYEPPKGIQFNMDMVNKELSKQINDRIRELNTIINNYNNGIKEWNVSYKYRFWNACSIKLNENDFKILKLSDFEL